VYKKNELVLPSNEASLAAECDVGHKKLTMKNCNRKYRFHSTLYASPLPPPPPGVYLIIIIPELFFFNRSVIRVSNFVHIVLLDSDPSYPICKIMQQ